MIDPEKLRRAREAKGLNRSQLSLAAGLARNAVHRLEDGTRGTQAQLSTAMRIAEALGVKVEAISVDAPTDPPTPTPRTTVPESAPEPDSEAWRWG